jgi:ribonuclease P protein component
LTKNTFIKQERLTGKTRIDRLFSSGKSFFCYPFRVAYHILEEGEEQAYPCRVLMNVPKRLHKTAVARNLIKRRIKEAYRLRKHEFYADLGEEKIELAILYSAKEVNDYDVIDKKLKEAQKILIKKLNTN